MFYADRVCHLLLSTISKTLVVNREKFEYMKSAVKYIVYMYIVTLHRFSLFFFLLKLLNNLKLLDL